MMAKNSEKPGISPHSTYNDQYDIGTLELRSIFAPWNLESELNLATSLHGSHKQVESRKQFISEANSLPRDLGYSGLEFLASWRLQIAASILAVCAFTCLISLGVVYEDQPLSAWKSQLFSINALVAALSTLMRGALVVPLADTMAQTKWSWFSASQREGRPLRDLERIDDVSRGAMGSLQWLLRTPLSSLTITVGSILTILMLAFDIFSQQFISIDTRQALSAQTAYVPWALTVASDDINSESAAFYDGALKDSIDDLPATCPTGNCTWEPVTSVGVCGACLDVTNTMSSQWIFCSETRCNYTGTRLTAELSNPNSPYNETQLLDYSGASLRNAPPPNSTIVPAEGDNLPYQVMVAGLGDYRFYDILGLQTAEHISYGNSWEVIEVPLAYRNWDNYTDTVFTTGNPTIHQCGLWFCLQHYEITVSDGRQSQSTRLGEPSYYTEGDDANGFPISWKFNTTTPQGRNFSVGSSAAYIGYMPDSISGTSTMDPQSILTDGQPLINVVWNRTRDDRDGWIQRIAKSMTNRLRLMNQVPPEQDEFRGKAFTSEAYIQVSWAWIVYPAWLLLSILTLFATNIVISARGEAPIWKNGIVGLALSDTADLVHSSSEEPYGSGQDLLSRVGGCKVVFEMNSSSWGFRMVSNETTEINHVEGR